MKLAHEPSSCFDAALFSLLFIYQKNRTRNMYVGLQKRKEKKKKKK